MMYSDGYLVIPLSNYDKVIKYGLIDWENVRDDNGNELKCTKNNFDRLPPDIRLELAGEIIRGFLLEEDAVKN